MIYSLTKIMLRLLLTLYNRLTIHDHHFIPDQGPFIVVSNHASYLDPIYIGVSFPRRLYFMAKKETFRYPFFNWILRYYGAFPVDRSKADLKAIRTAIGLLQAGKVLTVFPQGTRKYQLDLTAMKQGAAYFAIKTNTPIIPVYIKGTDKVMPKGQHMIKPSKVEVFIGEIIEVPKIKDAKQSQLMDIMTLQVKEAIQQLSQTAIVKNQEIGKEEG